VNRLIANRSSLVVPVLAVIVLVAFPLVTDRYTRNLGVLALIYATVAMSWDLTLGYAGVFNFAHLAFFGIGAYTSGVLAAHAGVSPWIGLLIGALSAVLISAVVFVPMSRLRGIYVALISFAFGQLTLRFVVSASDLTGGYLGLTGVPALTIGGQKLDSNSIAAFYLAGIIAVVAAICLRAFVRSDVGASLVALRDSEPYAASRGISVARVRLLSFLVSAAFTGLAGAFYTFYLKIITPEVLNFSLITLILSMVLLGGIATIYGPIAAAIILTFATDFMAPLGPYRFMIIAVLVIASMWLAPGGLVGLARQVTGRTRKADRDAAATLRLMDSDGSDALA
jgi:branched-chain amino acid transport system permease protein